MSKVGDQYNFKTPLVAYNKDNPKKKLVKPFCKKDVNYNQRKSNQLLRTYSKWFLFKNISKRFLSSIKASFNDGHFMCKQISVKLEKFKWLNVRGLSI